MMAVAHSNSIPLTQSEKDYLSAHPVIRVSNELDFAPFDFSAEGQPYGYSIDVLNLIAERTGLHIKYVNGYSWQEMVDQFKAGELDILHSLTRSPEREKYGLFSQPYFRFKFHFITRKDGPEIRYAEDIVGKVVALGRGWAHVRYLETYYPDIIIHLVDSYEEMLEAVSNGDADVTISDIESFQYTTRKLHIRNLKASGWFKEYDNGQSRKYRFMVQREAPELLSILNKGLATLTAHDIDVVNKKWFGADNSVQPVAILTPEEQAFLAKKPKAAFGASSSFEPFVIEGDTGKIAGYLVELSNMISQRTGLDIALDVGLWDEVQELARNRNLDGLALASRLSFYEDSFIASSTYAQLMNFVFVKRSNPLKIQSTHDLRGLRIAVPRGNKQILELLKTDTGRTAEIVWVDTSSDMIEAVISGKADYTIFPETAFFIAEQLGMRSMIEVAFPIGRPFDLVFQTRNDQPLLASIIEKGLQTLTPQERIALQRRWFNEQAVRAGETLLLTTQERKFLSSKDSLRMCGIPDWLPYQSVQNGEHSGMSADYMDLFSKRIGIEIRTIQTESWMESLQHMRDGACDVLPMAKLTADRAQYLDFSTPYISFPNVIAVRVEDKNIRSVKDIQNKPIAVVRGYAVITDLKERFPNIQLQEYESGLDALKAVQSGDAAAYIGAPAVIARMFTRYNFTDLKIVGRVPWGYTLSVATRNDEPLLRDIFQKAVDSLTPEDHKRIQDKWQAVQVQEVTNYSLLLLVISGASFVIGGVVVWNRQLQSARRRTERALRDLSDARLLLEQQNKELENLSVTDRLTQLFNRTKLDDVLTLEVLRANRQETEFSVMMLDLDHFKVVNDTHGHKVGDQVLVDLARLLSSGVRMTDVIGRWGGEEFMVLCIGTDLDGCKALAEKLRRQIETHDFPVIGHMTASFGVSMYAQEDTPDKLVDRADKAMYCAKTNGRNQVCSEEHVN